jgi:acetoin utilization protein AcuC
VPRAWTHLLSIVAGSPLDPETAVPEEWRRHVADTLGASTPTEMTDGHEPGPSDWRAGHDPGSWLDRSVQATRSAVFPALGLDP